MHTRKKVDKRANGVYFVLPFILGLFIFRVMPFIYTFFLSLTNTNMLTYEEDFVLFDNYIKLLKDPIFYTSLKNTIKLWAMNIFPRLAVAMLCAVIFVQSRVRGRQLFKMIFYFPNLVNSVSIAALATLVFGWQNGFFNKLLLKLGVIQENINWLGTVGTAQGICAFILWWMWFGYAAILFTTGILAVPNELLESAKIDGANTWQCFWKVTFPMIRPTVAYVFLTTLIGGLQNFETPQVLSGGLGAPDRSLLTMGMQMYNLAFRSMQYGYASTFAMGMFIFTAIVAAFTYRFLNKKND